MNTLSTHTPSPPFAINPTTSTCHTDTLPETHATTPSHAYLASDAMAPPTTTYTYRNARPNTQTPPFALLGQTQPTCSPKPSPLLPTDSPTQGTHSTFTYLYEPPHSHSDSESIQGSFSPNSPFLELQARSGYSDERGVQSHLQWYMCVMFWTMHAETPLFREVKTS